MRFFPTLSSIRPRAAMTKVLSSYLLLAKRTIYGVILVSTMVTGAVAQPPVSAPGPGVAPLPPSLPLDFNPAREQPAPVGQAETLETAWAVALNADQRIKASEWDVSAAQSGWNAARAERMPSLTMGAEYYAISQSPDFVATLGPL